MLAKTIYNLSNREIEVLKLIIEGMNNFEIAKALDISSHTSHAHVGSILRKLATKNRIKAAVKAVKENLL